MNNLRGQCFIPFLFQSPSIYLKYLLLLYIKQGNASKEMVSADIRNR